MKHKRHNYFNIYIDSKGSPNFNGFGISSKEKAAKRIKEITRKGIKK